MITGMSEQDPVREDRAATPLHGPSPSMSLAALRLHARGLLASFEAGDAGFVSDAYLDARPDSASEVLELCLAGVWTRADGGYAVVSSEALRMAYELHRQVSGTHRSSGSEE